MLVEYNQLCSIIQISLSPLEFQTTAVCFCILVHSSDILATINLFKVKTWFLYYYKVINIFEHLWKALTTSGRIVNENLKKNRSLLF